LQQWFTIKLAGDIYVEDKMSEVLTVIEMNEFTRLEATIEKHLSPFYGVGFATGRKIRRNMRNSWPPSRLKDLSRIFNLLLLSHLGYYITVDFGYFRHILVF
jgi:hypothetical protein